MGELHKPLGKFQQLLGEFQRHLGEFQQRWASSSGLYVYKIL